MKGQSRLFLILALFFWLVDAIYVVWNLNDPVLIANGQLYRIDWIGTVGMGLAGVLSAFISFYLGRVHAGQGGELPEDRSDALIDDGEAEQGFFSPWSWWPVMLGLSAAIVILGLAVGFWISFIGAAVLVISLVGWQYEYYRGFHAH